MRKVGLKLVLVTVVGVLCLVTLPKITNNPKEDGHNGVINQHISALPMDGDFTDTEETPEETTNPGTGNLRSGVLSDMLGYDGNEYDVVDEMPIYSESPDTIYNTNSLSESFRSTDTSHYHNLLGESPPKYLPNYKNPCWKEMRDVGGRDRRHTKSKTPWKLRCLPYFYLAGVHKAGTSDLFNRIEQHPLITRYIKEVHWWSRARMGLSVVRNWLNFPANSTIRQYVDVFDKSAEEIETKIEPAKNTGEEYHPMIAGEGCPSYMWYTHGWEAHPEQNNGSNTSPLYLIGHYIHHVTPYARIIFSFRNPTTREYSMYKFMGKNHSPQEFRLIVARNLPMMKSCLKKSTPYYCATNHNLLFKMRPLDVHMGMYAVFLEKWMTIFPWSQIYISRMEDYSANRAFYLNDIFQFLGLGKLKDKDIENIISGRNRNHNEEKAQIWGPIPEDSKKLLDDFFRPFNQQLAELLKDDRFTWMDQQSMS